MARRVRIRRTHWLALAVAVITLGIVFGFTPDDAAALRTPDGDAGAHAKRQRIALSLPVPALSPEQRNPAATAELPSQTATDQSAPARTEQWHHVTFHRGDSLAQVFSRLNLSPRDLHDIIALGSDTATLKRVYPGELVKLKTDAENELQELVYSIDEIRELQVVRDTDGWRAAAHTRDTEVRTAYANSVINSSLFLAGQRAGLSDNLIMQLAGIFGWDVDFALDIRRGDQFVVLYEEHYIDGKKVRDGDILAAEFTNRDRIFRAVRYQAPEGTVSYYTPDGLSMRRAFLRTPVEFSRISSGFSLRRKHPVLNRIRAHKGVDYAAPRGTPVKATGDGKIIYAGTKGGYGRTVILRHGSKYTTLYAHLSRFARGIRSGARAQQGQTIGYVGSTGLATGPHLHYEFRINGVHRNPLRVEFPQASPVADKHKEDFRAKTRPLISQLDVVKRTLLAQND